MWLQKKRTKTATFTHLYKMHFLQKLRGRFEKEAKYPKWRITQAKDVAQGGQYIDDLYNGKQQGFLIKNFLSKKELNSFRKNLKNWRAENVVELGFGKTIGKTLMGSAPDLEDYLGKAEIFKSELTRNLNFSFEARLLDLLNKVAGGRKVEIPTKNRQEYCLANIRVLEPGKGGLHAHIGNEFIERFSELGSLAEIAELTNQLSFFVVVQKPDSGGGLTIYDLEWENTPRSYIDGSLLYYSEERNKAMDEYKSFTIPAEEGDLILFTGGKVWHRVETPKGQSARITIGGFAAKSKDDNVLYVWS